MDLAMLQVLSPLLILILGVTLILILLLFQKDKNKHHIWFRILGLLTLTISLFLTVSLRMTEPQFLMERVYRWDQSTFIFTACILLMAIFTIVMTLHRKINNAGEWTFFVLCTVLGSCLAIGSADFIMLMVSLELIAIPTYIIVGMQHNRPLASEASWKYLITGGVATAIFLYGVSFLVGLFGKTNFLEIKEDLYQYLTSGAESSLIIISFIMVIIGLAIKLAIVPFHLWAQDVYRASDATTITWLLTVVKTSLLVVLMKLISGVYIFLFIKELDIGDTSNINAFFYTLAFVTIIVGNLASLFQKNVKNILAYTSIAQTGYFLIPFVRSEGMFNQIPRFIIPGSISFLGYIIAYAIAIFGSLAIVEIVTNHRKKSGLDSMAGLFRQAPFLSFAMLIFLFSLAGLPLTAGFFAKWYLFINVFDDFFIALPLVIVTIFSYVAYFRIVRQIFFRFADKKNIFVPWNLAITALLAIVGTVLLGIFPGTITRLVDIDNFWQTMLI